METITPEGLDELLRALSRDGYRVIGPVVRDGAIDLAMISTVGDLPAGWGDDQAPGRYRLHRRGDDALFGFAVGARSFRHLFQPPRERLYTIRKKGRSLEVDAPLVHGEKVALVGARACDLAALSIHDHVLSPDPGYAARRADVFVVSVTCGTPASTCFCTSMGGGPEPTTGFDLSLTELLDGDHRFVVHAATERGRALLAGVTRSPTTDEDAAARVAVEARARASITRTMSTERLPETLRENLEHPRWDELGHLCVACTSCTLVCPTCFCTATTDATPIASGESTRERRWDSCFSPEHSLMHGGSVRPTTASRYRQWLTHKLSSWVDQFGELGCVGCGRCIAWCPVGIDLTAEVSALAQPTRGA